MTSARDNGNPLRMKNSRAFLKFVKMIKSFKTMKKSEEKLKTGGSKAQRASLRAICLHGESFFFLKRDKGLLKCSRGMTAHHLICFFCMPFMIFMVKGFSQNIQRQCGLATRSRFEDLFGDTDRHSGNRAS